MEQEDTETLSPQLHSLAQQELLRFLPAILY
jgi:hypothetical protein